MRKAMTVVLLVALAALTAVTLTRLLPRQEQEKVYLIGMSQANLIEPWRVTMNLEFQQAAQAHENVRVIYTDGAQDTRRQIADVRMLMGYGIDLLVISPNDAEALRPVLSEVYRQIPVIVLDRAVSGGDYTLFIGPDNDRIGYLAGERVIEVLGKDGGTVVQILGTEDSPPVAARQAGFQRALKEHSEIRLEGVLSANWLQDQAQDRFREYLVIQGLVPDVVAAQNDAMAYGAWLASDALRARGITFIGVDGLDGPGGGIDLVERGILDSTIYCPTGASQAMEYSMRILSGERLSDKEIILEPRMIVDRGSEGIVANVDEAGPMGYNEPVAAP